MDDMLEENKILYDLGENTFIFYERFRFPWPLSNRDFKFALKVIERDDGFFIVTKSIDIPGPVVEGTVRGEIILSGFMLKRIEGGMTECVYLICIDPKGSIPKMVARQISKDQASNVSKIREHMTKLFCS